MKISFNQTIRELAILISISLVLATATNLLSPKGLFSFQLQDEGSFYDTGEISLDNALDAWKNGALFLDVRSESVYKEAHIRNAVSCSFLLFDEKIKLLITQLENAEQVIVYCSGMHCNSSKIICQRLVDMGFQNVVYFSGGFEAWQDAGLPVE